MSTIVMGNLEKAFQNIKVICKDSKTRYRTETEDRTAPKVNKRRKLKFPPQLRMISVSSLFIFSVFPTFN